MGYTTNFRGSFKLDRPLSSEHYEMLKDFSQKDHRDVEGVPSYSCDWEPSKDGMAIQYNGNEKFYEYIPWIKYIVREFLIPWGYKLNGQVMWHGEDVGDTGFIIIKDNEVSSKSFKDFTGEDE